MFPFPFRHDGTLPYDRLSNVTAAVTKTESRFLMRQVGRITADGDELAMNVNHD
jgi:hypothetical protein